MIVEEMNILTTSFLRYDNQKIIFPNSVLATKAIHNFYRSPDMGDAVEFCLHICTPPEKIAIMRQRIIRYVEKRKHSLLNMQTTPHFSDSIIIVVLFVFAVSSRARKSIGVLLH